MPFATKEMRQKMLAEKKAKAERQARITRSNVLKNIEKPITDKTYVRIAEPKNVKPAAKKETYKATKEDMEYSKRMNIPLEDVIAQGGVTPAALAKEIQEKRSYDVKYGPGLYKKAKKK